MKKSFRILAVAALACAVVACNKEEKGGPTDYSEGCEAVDMGIVSADGVPVKWAAWNVGAAIKEDFGLFFAWGETAPKERYTCEVIGDYAWGVKTGPEDWEFTPTKYSGDGGDGLTVLLPEDDAATRNWGTKWRTPTLEEISALVDPENCVWEWNEKKTGYVVTSRRTGNTLFFPMTGNVDSLHRDRGIRGCFWASTLGTDGTGSMLCGENIVTGGSEKGSVSRMSRWIGCTVRAVTQY